MIQLFDLLDLANSNPAPTGENIIEAASIIAAIADPGEFRNFFIQSIKLANGETSDTHRALLSLHPKGIVTFNYDDAHETSIEQAGLAWQRLLPDSEGEIIELLSNRLNSQFVFKAHGTIEKPETMVLTGESYRDILVKRPVYRAFIQHLFTNYQMLIVGFGLSDPDFDTLMQIIFNTYGGPIQKHVVIRHEREKAPKDILLERKYGLHFLYIRDYPDIPIIIEDCMYQLGSLLEPVIDACVSLELSARQKANAQIRNLSEPGKRCIANVLQTIIREVISHEKDTGYNRTTELSELIYTFGVVAYLDDSYKQFLIDEVIEKSIDSEPVIHALVHVRDSLKPVDIPMVAGWIARFRSNAFRPDSENPDPDNRVVIYTEYLRAYLRAKFKAFD